jgi:hypothetical protein
MAAQAGHMARTRMAFCTSRFIMIGEKFPRRDFRNGVGVTGITLAQFYFLSSPLSRHRLVRRSLPIVR